MLRRSVLLALCMLVFGPAWSTRAALDPTLVAWWPFDEGAGTVAVDGTGNGNDATLEGGIAWLPGVLDMAVQFNGSDTRAVAPDIPLDSRSFTIAMWVNAQLSSGEQVVYSHGLSGSNNTDLHLRIGGPGSGNVPAGGVRMGFYNNDIDTAGGLIEVGNWYHITFWYDFEHQNRKIYINGVIEAEGAATPYLGSGSNTIIGAWGTGQRFDGIIDDVQVYHRALADAEVAKIMFGLADQSLAQAPSPLDEAIDVPRDVVLGWEAGEFAASHDVYVGTTFDDVNEASRGNPGDVLVSRAQAATSYDPEGLLEFGQTYYWRVDEVNAAPDNTIFKGEVWSFTAEPFTYPITDVIATSSMTSEAGAGPEKTVDGSGLNAAGGHSTASADMWLGVPGADPAQIQFEFDRVYKLYEMLVWNYNVQFELILGFGLKDVTVEYSENGIDWVVLGDVQFAQATARANYLANTTVAFDGVAAKYVRLTVNSGYGMMGQYGLSEVRFMYIPAQARQPQPAVGETGVTVGTTLSWRAGREAVTHNVYLSTDPNALAQVGSVSPASYVPADLQFGSTYYWKIDEVNEADAVTVWEGDLWSFATQEYAVIDDFESYDDEGNRIYDTWLDGWVNDTGSTVGYLEEPFAEKTIVHGGAQSMPLGYGNSTAPFYSETEFDLGGANWNTNGADMLRLFVSGLAPGFEENADGTILMNGIGTDIWNTGDQFRFAYKSLSGNGSMVARVDSFDATPDVWVKVGVMIRQGTTAGSQHSFMPLTGSGGNGASWQGRTAEGQASVNQDATSVVAPPYWVRIDRSGNTFTGYISPDGQSWQQIGDPRTVAMTDPVLIGLAVTSHNANRATSAQISNVSFTGNVTGAWKVAEIGVAQPRGNTPQSMYVAVEDSAGKVAVVMHPDATITARSGWTEWVIPYGNLAGVNLSNISTLYIGVGNRNNPSAGGSGTVFIDDVGYGHPVP